MASQPPNPTQPPYEQPQAQPPPPSSCWSNIVKQAPTRNPNIPSSTPTKLVESCKSTKGIALAVVDANAIIQGGERLPSFAEKFVSVCEVLTEIRDPTSRHRLSFLPFPIDTLEPSPESLKKVINFARATGDLQTLSDVDLKLIALTYTLEAQIHGTSHLRDCPPPVHVLNVRRLPEKDLPGWGDNVPNLEEWEALECAAGSGRDPNSKILPLKDLNLSTFVDDSASLQNGSVGNGSEGHLVDHDDVDPTSRKYKKYSHKKREVKIDGKKMVADGVDASQGQCDDDAGDWLPAVSRSTHRRFLRGKARRERYEGSLKDEEQEDTSENTQGEVTMEPDCSGHTPEMHPLQGGPELENNIVASKGTEDISSILEHMRLEEDALLGNEEQDEIDNSNHEAAAVDTHLDEGPNDDVNDEALDQIENGSVDTSCMDDEGSEQSWMLRSLSDSSVACITGDFAMQNVILQMGLRLLAPGGMQIRELNRWVLKCHACQHVTAEVGRIFCPRCGNGGTLRKVAVTVGENGVVLAARKPRISKRGTKFSLPLPKGGRDAISKNPILREDQVPVKYLYEKPKKKSNKVDDDNIFASATLFSHHTDKKNSRKPPVREALAYFSGKRNPNDNHYSRAKH